MSAEQLLPENCDNEGWRFLTERYQRYDHGHYNVTTQALNDLLRCEIILDEMMRHAVHEWEGFEECMEAVAKLLKNGDEE